MGRKQGKRHRHGGQGLARELRAGLRQATFPAPIRIHRSPYDQNLDAWIERFLADAQSQSEKGEAEPSKAPVPTRRPGSTEGAGELEDFFKSQMELMLRVGTGLWRLRQRSRGTDGDEPSAEARRTHRHLEGVWEAIAEAGYTIVDHTNERYEPRMALRVISIEPIEGQVGEVVQETLKPSIYYKERCIQMGEVIIAVPKEPLGPPAP